MHNMDVQHVVRLCWLAKACNLSLSLWIDAQKIDADCRKMHNCLHQTGCMLLSTECIMVRQLEWKQTYIQLQLSVK